ncbi:MAG: type I DNA topoisomerase [Bacteroidaceae bacterium]|nr:type I DNA topoisomerase [Bacteroidaceae bacterium]
MQDNLVIVESPAKAKTIEKFLGKDYKVLSSYGHIRDLKKRDLSVDIETFDPEYEIPSDKIKVVQELKDAAKKAKMVWLASDEDREGEAISWHLFEVLELKPENTKRIVFHEITKNAIIKAIEEPRDIDINLVYAQQARRVLDRIVGFRLSPVLWRKVKPSLSAGRVQSVAVRLIVEREREIKKYTPETSYRIIANLNSGRKVITAEMRERLASKQDARSFLDSCVGATFSVSDIQKKPLHKSPAPPFTTSTLQQEAARKFGFTVMQTMMIAQRLYESGKITYMRTDSVNLSSFCINSCKTVIADNMGDEYVFPRQYHQKAKGAQEAHEAIRPTDMNISSIDGSSPEKRLYELIWKRTISSQMADAQTEKTIITISSDKSDYQLQTIGECVKFDGFLKVYNESHDDETEDQGVKSLPSLKVGQILGCVSVQAVERFSQHPPRYNEAALVHKLEELGIGRPSTYAPTISTIQQREYVVKENVKGVERQYNLMLLADGKISDRIVNEMYGAEKSKLLPTDTGMVVNDFLKEFFPNIMDYNFTAKVEKEFDEIADGDKQWKDVISDFYSTFEPMVDKTLSSKGEHKVGERVLGIDPKSGKPVSAKIGRFGPVVQIGSAEDSEKPRFAQMKKGQSIESITLDEALELFLLPRTLGTFNGSDVTVGAGRFGPYVHCGSVYVSLKGDYNPYEIGLEEAVSLIQSKRENESKKILRSFPEDDKMFVLNGRYGPYISFKGNNYKIPKEVVPEELTYDACMKMIDAQADKTVSTTKRRVLKTKK